MRKSGFIGLLCGSMLLLAACQTTESAAPAGSPGKELTNLSTAAGSAQQIEWQKILIGAWQDSAEIAAAYTDLYQFKEDGTFRFTPNEMICDNRNAGYSGEWTVDGQQLQLTVLKEREWVGGTLEPATGSCRSEKQLVDATLKTKEVNPPRKMAMPLTSAEPSPTGYPAIKLGDASYYRIFDKPLEEEDGSMTGEDSRSPEQIFRSKVPDARVVEVITEDLNHDQVKESVILTEEGTLYFLSSDGELSLVAKQLVSEEGAGEPATIRVLPPVSKETHVAVIYSYLPSNTQIMLFAIRENQLETVFEAMGDQGIALGENNTIIQHWKSYRQEGGWDYATTVYQWNEEKREYVKGKTEIKKEK